VNTLESAYFRGREACADGKRQDTNPHPLEADEHGHWNRGWTEEFRTLPQALKTSRLPKEASDAAE
jgi:ribosome modulation factor